MNTSKSLKATLTDLKTSLNDLHTRYYKREIPDVMTFTDLQALEVDYALAAIVEAVEGLIPQQKSVTKMNGAFYKSEFQQIKGYNTAISEVLQAIKEWQ